MFVGHQNKGDKDTADHGFSYACQLCSDSFLTKKELQTHEKSHPLTCELCNKTFEYLSGLKLHRNTYHLKLKKFSCDNCGAKFATKNHVILHQKSKRNCFRFKEKLSCQICDNLSFSNKLDLQRHSKEAHGNQCPICFKYDNNLRRHMLRHSNKSEFSCFVCGEGFRIKETLDTHKCKGAPQEYTCVFCDKVFNDRLAFVRHRQTEHRDGPQGTKYKCDFCQKEFKAYVQLMNHRVKHTGEKNFPCKVCGHFYANQTSFRHHKCVPPQKCEVCQEVFKTAAQLKRHMYLHTEERPFNCDICKRSFLYKNNFKKHNCNIKAKPRQNWKGKKL